ncbi:MAG: hypothetical protein ABI823_05595 [Bryobacteraceae bacterium]
MEILGDRKFVEVPGGRNHELPPLLVKMKPQVRSLDRVMTLANGLIEQEDMIPTPSIEALLPEEDLDRARQQLERSKMDLALNLVDQYLGLIKHWQWGDGILEWIRQCETTFETRSDLRALLHPDVWPHAGRSSFVRLLEDKAVATHGVEIEKAVGLRLTFRQPPPMSCCSNQFLFYLNGTLGHSAYDAWAGMTPDPISALPPERFSFEVVNMEL